MKAKSKRRKSPALDEARLAVSTADAGVREAKEKAQEAESALKAARKACKRADKVAKKARKEARRARKRVKLLLVRQAKPKKQTVARRGSPNKKKTAAPSRTATAEAPLNPTSPEILGEHR